jgi:type VI secretion system protein ImpJ
VKEIAMLHKPHWTHGLELGSHHFQLLDRYHEELIAHRMDALFDHTWGIHEVRWDTRAIGAGQVALQKLDAILPDGTPVVCDPADGLPTPAVPIRDFGKNYALEVYVGVRRLNAGTPIDSDSRGAQKYLRESILVPDFASGNEPVRVDCLRPNVKLLLEGEPLQDFVTLHCARILRSPAGHLAFDDAFVPPVLTIGASPYLGRELRRALDALMARQALQARTSPRDVTEAVQRWLGSLIGSFVPRLADLVHQCQTHPLVAYRVLAELLGSLAPFTPTGDYRIPAFQYDQLGPIFAELFAGLGAALDAIGADHHRRIPLARFDPTTLFGDLGEPAIFRNDFFLRVTGSDVDELRVRVPQHFKVASWTNLPEVVRSATAGVALKHDPRPPAGLPGGPATVYFKLEKTDAFTPIVKTGQMGIHHVLGLPLTDIALFAVEPGAP